MNAYSLTLFLHFVFLLAAVVASALAGFAAFRLRRADTTAEAVQWEQLIERVVRTFPVASLGLIGTGAYMTSKVWTWSTPWVVAGLAGLATIIVLGAGVEGRCARATRAELRAAGLSQRATRLLRDPVDWSARTTTWTLLLAVTFVMTAKPAAVYCALALALALVCGLLLAVPFWSGEHARALSRDPIN